MVDLVSIANEVSTVDEALAKALPTVAVILGFIPGANVAAPFVAEAGPVLMALDDAVKLVASNKPGASPKDIFEEIISHLTAGMPNSPILSAPPAAADPSAAPSDGSA